MLKFLLTILIGRDCAHAWTLVAEKEFPPPIYVFREYFEALIQKVSISFQWKNGEEVEMSKRTYFAVVKCDKCGAIKEFERRA